MRLHDAVSDALRFIDRCRWDLSVGEHEARGVRPRSNLLQPLLARPRQLQPRARPLPRHAAHNGERRCAGLLEDWKNSIQYCIQSEVKVLHDCMYSMYSRYQIRNWSLAITSTTSPLMHDLQRLQTSGQDPNLVSTRPDLSQDVQAVQDMVRAVSERRLSREEERRGSRGSTSDGEESERKSSRKKRKEKSKTKDEEEAEEEGDGDGDGDETRKKRRSGHRKDAKKHESHHRKRSENSSSNRSDDSSRRPSGASFVSFTSNSELENLRKSEKRKKKKKRQKEKEEKRSRKNSEEKPSFLKKVLSAKSLSSKRDRELKERSSDEQVKGSPRVPLQKSGSGSSGGLGAGGEPDPPALRNARRSSSDKLPPPLHFSHVLILNARCRPIGTTNRLLRSPRATHCSCSRSPSPPGVEGLAGPLVRTRRTALDAVSFDAAELPIAHFARLPLPCHCWAPLVNARRQSSPIAGHIWAFRTFRATSFWARICSGLQIRSYSNGTSSHACIRNGESSVHCAAKQERRTTERSTECTAII